MSSITHRLLKNVSSTETAVRVERASADVQNGLAKVLFTTNMPTHKADLVVANSNEMQKAFGKLLGDKAHLVTASIHKSEVPGHYFGFVKMNQPVVAHEDAVKEGSGFTMLSETANCFADANDDIWEVREDASGRKVLLRNSQEDLTELFNTISPPANMSVAASATKMDAGKLEFASLVTFLDPETEKYTTGVALDTATVYDFDSKKAKEVNPALVVASSDVSASMRRDLSARTNSEVATFAELSALDAKAVYDYLDILYGRMPEFLAAYKEAVRRLLG